MSTKHGQWFNRDRYFKIHKDVIKKFEWLVKSGDKSYSITEIDISKGVKYIEFQLKFISKYDHRIKIYKRARLDNEAHYSRIKTMRFFYDCFDDKTNKKILQYHSPHIQEYHSHAPWHDRAHRHTYKGNIQIIDVYSKDHRPKSEKERKYLWENGAIQLNFLGHEDWPHVMEFLEEVGNPQRLAQR